MKTGRLIAAIYAVVLIGSMAGCQTGKPVKKLSDDGLMYAMIYDHANVPVSGVTVYINDKKIVDSDIQGRFVLEAMQKGVYRIRLVKKGYENFEDVFEYVPMQVLYLKMSSTAQLVTQAETAIDGGDLPAAENFITRALSVEPNRPDVLYLKSIVYYLQNRDEEAIAILEEMIASGYSDQSVSGLLDTIRILHAEQEP